MFYILLWLQFFKCEDKTRLVSGVAKDGVPDHYKEGTAVKFATMNIALQIFCQELHGTKHK